MSLHSSRVECIDANRLQRQPTAVTHRSFAKSINCLQEMAKLLVLAACTSALLQQPARRVSLTPRMGVVQPWVEINQSIEPTRPRGQYQEDGVESHTDAATRAMSYTRR